MRLLILTAIILTVSCRTKLASDQFNPLELKEKAEQSKKIILERKELISKTTLIQRAAIFESKILTRMHPTHKFAPKLYIDGSPGKLRMDMTCLFLSALAYKFAVTKDSVDKENILKILSSIYDADRSNGLDGFIPYKVIIEGDELKTSSNETHINVYTQLLFAYIPLLKFSKDGEIQDAVTKHLKLIYKHLMKNDFQLVDHEGHHVKYSDLSPSGFSLQSNRKQLLLVLTDLALHISWSSEFHLEMSELRHQLTKLGYEESIQRMHIKILNLEFPTHSSSWLNLMNSYLGFIIEKKSYYKTAYCRLFRNYKDENNLLFELMHNIVHSKYLTKDKLIAIEESLNNFPSNPANVEIINSPLMDHGINSSAPFVKLKRELETESPLPIHHRPMRSFEWKLNQMRIDGNFTSPGTSEYTGIDFLIAYWMLEWQKNQLSFEDK